MADTPVSGSAPSSELLSDATTAADDAAIIQRVRSGQREAYATLVRRYQAKVLRSCVSALGDATEAEDAAQDIFIKAYRSLDAFRSAASFSTWLYRITANHCLDLLRKRSRQRTTSWDALVEEAGELAHPAVQARDVAHAQLIEHALSSLTPDDRTIVVLREVQGLSYQELAAVLQCSVDAVKARLRRARQELARRLRHLLEAPDV